MSQATPSPPLNGLPFDQHIMFDRVTTINLFPTFLRPSISRVRPRRCDHGDLERRSIHSPQDNPDFRQAHDNSLRGYESHLKCATCSADISSTSQIVSKGFTGRHGRAYLISPATTLLAPRSQRRQQRSSSDLPNTRTDAPSKRQLVTGLHTVSDVRCALCGSMLGWKYEGAEDESQKYKIGKYILETKMTCLSSNWEQSRPHSPSIDTQVGRGVKDERPQALELEFDSQDEDECEDLFAGVWTPGLALRRRQDKVFRNFRTERAANRG